MHSLKETEEDSSEALDLSEKATSSEDWQQLQSLASTFSGVDLILSGLLQQHTGHAMHVLT